MKIEWIGQSGYILKTDKTELIIDPYLSDIVNKVANRPRLVEPPVQPEDIRADAVICTHDHLDHLDPDAIMQMDDSLMFITTGEGKAHLEQLGKSNVRAVGVGDTVSVGDMTVTAVYANHTVDAFGLIIMAEGKTLYFSSDTLYDEKLFDIARFAPDVAFICINGKLGNMDVDQAVTVAEKIGAAVSVPNHYGMFASNTEDPAKFTGRVKGSFEMQFARQYDLNEILG